MLELCGDVAAVVWLLGSATGDSETISAIHGARLERLLEKLVDSPVRGFAYEAAGSVARETLAEGARIVERAGHEWRIPVRCSPTVGRSRGGPSTPPPRSTGLLTG